MLPRGNNISRERIRWTTCVKKVLIPKQIFLRFIPVQNNMVQSPNINVQTFFQIISRASTSKSNSGKGNLLLAVSSEPGNMNKEFNLGKTRKQVK